MQTLPSLGAARVRAANLRFHPDFLELIVIDIPGTVFR
jgi:hypothetical protein